MKPAPKLRPTTQSFGYAKPKPGVAAKLQWLNRNATSCVLSARRSNKFRNKQSGAIKLKSKQMAMCGDRKDPAPALLIVEQLPSLVAEQVKTIQNLQIGKITVWESANGAKGCSAADFLRGLIGSLPPLDELAKQADIELPEVLGEISDARDLETTEAHKRRWRRRN